MYNVLMQDFESGQACCVKQHHYARRDLIQIYVPTHYACNIFFSPDKLRESFPEKLFSIAEVNCLFIDIHP
jgi:hypothetical protein